MDEPQGTAASEPGASFGEQLRRARDATGLTQEELAARAGLTPNAISALERGEHRHPYPATVRALAAALGLTAAECAALAASVPKRGRPAQLDAALPGLPALLSPLVGRERELADVVELLRQDNARLVTLTGPGGVGKTRLALQVATDLAGEFAHGAKFVSLAAVHDPTLVASTIAHALGVVEAGGRSPVDRLGDELRKRHLLLVLDNYEHLLDAAPLVTELLTRCPALAILATSRSSLRLGGEHVVPVPPLALPDLERLPVVERLAEIGAVRLFVDRVRAADPAFVLTGENAGAVAAICHRLDGLPLAIELAAARSTVFTPAAMLPRLAQRLPLLTSGRRDAPDRHRTMRDAIAWSHDLLGEADQILFRRLAVFVAGFSPEAAEFVTGDGGGGVLNGVAALVDHQMIGRVDGPDGEPRFALLETIREYAREQLEVSGEEPAVRERHAGTYLWLAERAEPALLGPDQVVWLDRLEAEVANLRAALAWLRDVGEAERGLRLAAALWTFWVVRDRAPEGQRWLETFLAMDAVEPAGRARALIAVGDLAERQGDYDAAVARLDEAVALARVSGDQAGEAAALRARGNTAISRGEVARWRLGDEALAEEEFTRAEALLGQSLALAREARDAWGVAKTKHWLGIVALERGDLGRAAAAHEDALADFRSLGDHRQICTVVGNLGAVAEQAGDLARAQAALAESLVLAQRLEYRWWIGWCLDNLGRVAAATGQSERAARLLGAAAALRPATGEPVRSGLECVQAEMIAMIRATLGEPTTATALAAGAALSLDEAIAEALTDDGALSNRHAVGH